MSLAPGRQFSEGGAPGDPNSPFLSLVDGRLPWWKNRSECVGADLGSGGPRASKERPAACWGETPFLGTRVSSGAPQKDGLR